MQVAKLCQTICVNIDMRLLSQKNLSLSHILLYFRSMIQVHLKQLKFHAFHGLYPGEELTGGSFEVNLTVSYEPVNPVVTIEQTVNYVVLYNIVKQHMQVPTGLIETVAENICTEVKKEFPFINGIVIDIDKCSPPIEQFEGRTGITVAQSY